MSLYTSGRARRSLIDTVAFRAVSQLATILGYVVMVRAMTKEDFGVFNLLYSFIPVVSTVASLGLEQTLRRYQPEYLESGNRAGAFWLVRVVASARFGTNVIVLSLVLFGWNTIAPIFKLAEYRAEFVLFCLLVLLHFQAGVLQLSLGSHMLHKYSVGSVAMISVVKLVTYSLLALFGAFSLENAVIADTVAFAVVYVYLLRAYRKHCVPTSLLPKYRPEAWERRRLLRYGALNNFNDAGTLFLNSKVDNFYIAALLDPLSVGIYAFYARLNEMANHLLPVRFFENVVQPMFFAVPAAEARDKVPRYFSFLIDVSLLLQWPILVLSIFYHEEIVRLVFGGKFIEHAWLLPLIIGFSLVNVIAIPVTLVAQYEEKAGVILLSKMFGAYNVAAMFLLVPTAGVFGAAIASGSAQVLKNGFIWWRTRGSARWLNVRGALVMGFAFWVVVGAFCYLVKRALGASDLGSLCAGLAIIGTAALIQIRGPALSASDRQVLEAVLRGKEAVVARMLGFIAR